MTDLGDLARRAESDGTAALALAEARLLGVEGAPDLAATFAAVEQSARLGNVDGRRALVYLTGLGIGTKASPDKAKEMLRALAADDRFAAVQLAFLEHLTCTGKLAEIQPTIVSSDPYIAVYPGLFSAAECQYLMTVGTPWLRPARILGHGGQYMVDPMRDAAAASLPSLAEDLVVQSINRCIAAATRSEPSWGEPLTILRYTPGQQYRPHLDVYGPDKTVHRVQTALIWLNDGYEGGETDFPNLKVTVRGAVGDMLVFRNLTADDRPEPRMLHAGLPVTSGVKWMASRWIRGQGYLG